jgi:sugar lactone lactonase YvrE
MEIELLVSNDTQLGEGPVWDHRTNILYWVDIEKKHIQAYDYRSGNNQVYKMNEYVGAAVPTNKGKLVVALQNQIVLFDPEDQQIETLCVPEPGKQHHRFNDGKCDPGGRFWIGSTQIDHKDPTGVLYTVTFDGSYTGKLNELHISNGMAWSLDGKSFYFIDSPTLKVQVFDFDLETAGIKYRDNVVVFDPGNGVPDGMCIDTAGNLWIAFYGAGKVGCYDPVSGQELAEVKLAAKNTTSCCFGGTGMDELFITTAKRDDPNGGGLYRCKPGVSGPRAHFFQENHDEIL